MADNSHVLVTDPRLAQRVADIAQLLRDNATINLKAICADAPELYEQLEMLLPTMQAVAAYEQSLVSARMDRDIFPHNSIADFRIIRELGRGGMGIVYEAQQLSLNRRVALKTLPLASLAHERQITRFKKESQAAALLQHSNIVPVYSVGCDQGVHYYVMQYIEGQTLAEMISQMTTHGTKEFAQDSRPGALTSVNQSTSAACEASIDPPSDNRRSSETPSKDVLAAIIQSRSDNPAEFFATVARIGIQAAEALAYAHQQAIVHRDIKPANLLLDLSGKLWITDFGLAQFQTHDQITVTGDMPGTLKYMSPEQISAQRSLISASTDIYSLGVTLYELIALRTPFDGSDRHALTREIIERDPISLRYFHQRVPRDLDTIIAKCIAKRIDHRYTSSNDVADDLRRFLHHRPITARRATPVHRLLKWVRRHRSLSAMIIVTSALLSVAMYWTTSRERERRDREANRERVRMAHEQHVQDALAYAFDLAKFEEFKIDGNSGELRSVLGKYVPRTPQPDLRGFEWFYHSACLEALSSGQRVVPSAHSRQIYCVTFSRDGCLVASCSEDASIKIWEYPQMKLKATLIGHVSDANWSVFAPDDRTLASCSDDGTVRIWDLETGMETLKIRSHRPWGEDGGRSVAYRIGFSPDGKTLVTMHGREAKLWDAQSGEPLGALPGRGLAVANQHPVVITALDDSSVAFWDIKTREQVGRIETRSTYRSLLSMGQLSVADSMIALGGDNGYLALWTLSWEDHKPRAIKDRYAWTGRAAVQSLNVSQDGTLVAVSTKAGCITVWDATSAKRVAGPYVHSSRAWCATFSPQGEALLTCGQDGDIRIRGSRSKQFSRSVCKASAYSTTSGEYLADHPMFVWLTPRNMWRSEGESFYVVDTRTWEKLFRHEIRTDPAVQHDSQSTLFVNAIAASPDKRHIAITGGGGVFLWDAQAPSQRPRSIVVWERRTDQGRLGDPVAPEDSPGSAVFVDPKRLAVIHEGATKLVDVELGSVIDDFRPPESSERHRRLAVSPDGRLLAIGGVNGSLWIFDTMANRWQACGAVASHAISAIEFLPPSQRLALGCDDGTIAIWNLEQSRRIHDMRGHSGPVSVLAWDESHQRLASAGWGDDGRVRLWNVDIARQVGSLETESGCDIYDLTFKPHNTTLTACGSVAGQIGKVFLWGTDDTHPFP